MATTVRPPDLQEIEEEALSRLGEEEGQVQSDVESAAEEESAKPEEPERSPYRIAVAVALPTIASALMVGGIFTGVGGRLYALVAGLLGIGLAIAIRRQRSPLALNLLVLLGLFAIGLLMVVPSGIGNIGSLRALVAGAAKSGDVLRPPVGLQPGWQAIIGWVMGTVGFVAAWLAIPVRRPSLGILLPLPVAAFAGISVPEAQQIPSGIAVLGLFAAGLGVLSSANEVESSDERPPLAYEVRKAIRSLPLIAVILVAMFGLSKAGFLFPETLIDPTKEPQRPKTIPLSEVEDRVLFDVEASISGPWRVGSLDVYDGKDWRLPPFAASTPKVPRNGIVDRDLQPGVKATFTVAGLGGTTLPGLPNMVALVAEGPELAFDSRNAAIKLAQGQVQAGLKYAVTAAALPSVEDLKKVTLSLPKDVEQFAKIGSPPPAVQGLIDQAPKTSKWEEFDFLRTHVLDNVTASGTGIPKSVTPERLNEILSGSDASPYEIVAAQAMLARYIGLPSRIGYGYDGGEVIEGKLQVRPKNGASFVEVYFPGFKWLPIIGTPKKAKPTVGDTSQQQFDPNILPSNEIAVQLYLPVVTAPESILADQIRRALLIGVPLLLLALLIYVTFPALFKAIVRTRRRSAARAAGPRAQVALAYAEWRDYATDFGFSFPTDTPLMFLDRFVEDPEHAELAWLVTRGLWGDLQQGLGIQHVATAEELSRALRRRLAQSQPGTVRTIAFVSRLSVRHPFAPETDLTRRKERLRVASATA